MNCLLELMFILRISLNCSLHDLFWRRWIFILNPFIDWNPFLLINNRNVMRWVRISILIEFYWNSIGRVIWWNSLFSRDSINSSRRDRTNLWVSRGSSISGSLFLWNLSFKTDISGLVWNFSLSLDNFRLWLHINRLCLSCIILQSRLWFWKSLIKSLSLKILFGRLISLAQFLRFLLIIFINLINNIQFSGDTFSWELYRFICRNSRGICFGEVMVFVKFFI